MEQIPARGRWDLVPRYRLTAPLVYETRDGETITVPVGFVTDGASVTRWLIWLIATVSFMLGWVRSDIFFLVTTLLLLICTRTGPWMMAAVVHDFLGCSKRNDRIFREAMFDSRCFEPIAWLFWAGPRMFGRIYRIFYNLKHGTSSDV